jgi:hypothetical protein
MVPYLIIIALVSLIYGMFMWRVNSATYYSIDNLKYERVEPEKGWRTHDYVIFINEKGEKIKYLCPESVYRSMEYDTRYNVTIIEGDFSLPGTKVKRVTPSNSGI